MIDVVIAVPTFRRPEGIAAASAECLAQAALLESATESRARASVLIVDNDPEASARSLIEPTGARYVHEPRPGIAAVRNRAIAESSTADVVIFIDDDEVPNPGWLTALVGMYLDQPADAVAGRVETIFPDDAPEWVRVSGAFIRPVRTDGQLIPEAASNNLLLDLSSLRRLQITFDERFGLTGGSDSMVTRLLTSRGGTIRWAQHAVVTEREDPGRFTRAWVLQRTFRFGNTSARVAIALARTPLGRVRARAGSLMRGLARCASGAVRVVFGVATRSLRHRARGERTFARGAGLITAAVGYAHDEYGRRRAKGSI